MRGNAEVLDIEVEGQVLVEAEPVLADERRVGDQALAVEGLNGCADGDGRTNGMATRAVLLAFLDTSEKLPLVVDAADDAGGCADWPPKTSGIERGQAVGEVFLQLKVLVAEDIPGIFVRRTRIKNAVVTDADPVVSFAVVNHGKLASAAEGVVLHAAGVHVEVSDGGYEDGFHAAKPPMRRLMT